MFKLLCNSGFGQAVKVIFVFLFNTPDKAKIRKGNMPPFANKYN